MKKMILLVGFFWACTSISFAIPISFTHQGSGSGTLGGTSFSNSLFTITGHADTADRTTLTRSGIPFGFSLVHETASINIAGLGEFTFITGTRTFVNNNTGRVGFSRSVEQGDLFNGPGSSLFLDWDMLSSIDPITGPGAIYQWTDRYSPVYTDGGLLEFVTSYPTTKTFEAAIAAPVPEPNTLLLLSAGLGGLMLYRRKPEK